MHNYINPIGEDPSQYFKVTEYKSPTGKNITFTVYSDSTNQQGWNNSRIVKINSSCTNILLLNETGGNYNIGQNISLPSQTTSEVSGCQLDITLENMCGQQETISHTIGKLK